MVFIVPISLLSCLLAFALSLFGVNAWRFVPLAIGALLFIMLKIQEGVWSNIARVVVQRAKGDAGSCLNDEEAGSFLVYNAALLLPRHSPIGRQAPNARLLGILFLISYVIVYGITGEWVLIAAAVLLAIGLINGLTIAGPSEETLKQLSLLRWIRKKNYKTNFHGDVSSVEMARIEQIHDRIVDELRVTANEYRPHLHGEGPA
jgi:hypothetical protein